MQSKMVKKDLKKFSLEIFKNVFKRYITNYKNHKNRNILFRM